MIVKIPFKIKLNRTSKSLDKRHQVMIDLAAEKQCIFGWDNEGTHYRLYITNLKTNVKEEEIVLVRGIRTIEMIHRFYDILEKKMKNY